MDHHSSLQTKWAPPLGSLHAQEKHTNPTLVFEDGTKYNGDAWKQFPWWKKAYRLVQLRWRIARKDDVDWTKEELGIMTRSPQLYHFKSRWEFEICFSLIVILNTVTMGMKVDALDPDALGFQFAEHIFCAFFLVEWCFQVFVEGPLWLCHGANMFDTTLVFVGGVMPIWILPAARLRGGFWGNVGGIFTIFRCLRIFRIYRLLKRTKQRDLWMLIIGVMASFRSFAWAMVLLAAFMFIASIFLRFVIGGDYMLLQADTSGDIERNLGSVPATMWFLFATFTDGVNWLDVVNQVIDLRPHYWLYFAAFVCLGQFIMLNLITAVIVEHAFGTSHQELEHEAQEAYQSRCKTIERVIDIFKECDINGDGCVDRQEFEKMCAAKKMVRLQRLLQFDEAGKDLLGLFDIIDVDKSGYLSLEEYEEVLFKILNPPATLDVLKILGYSVRNERRLDGIVQTGVPLNAVEEKGHSIPQSPRKDAEGSSPICRMEEAINTLTDRASLVQRQVGQMNEECRRMRKEVSELRHLVPSNRVAPDLSHGVAKPTPNTGHTPTGTSATLLHGNGSSLQGCCSPTFNGTSGAHR